ncbi:MAG: tetratricopeptide repeat protein [Gemmatimonadota bacterium]
MTSALSILPSLLLALALTPPGPPPAEQTAIPCVEPDVRTVTQLRDALSRLEGEDVASSPDVGARCELAFLYLHTGRLAEAEALLLGVVEEDPDLVDALLALARVFGEDERDEEVTALLDRARRVAPDHLELRLLEAHHIMERVDPEEAHLLFASILQDDPTVVPALAGQADARLRLGREEEARPLLERALALDSLYAPAHRLLADVHRRALDEEARAHALHRALALDSLDVESQRAMATMLRQNGDVEAAYARFMTVLGFNPTQDGVHRDLGNGGSLISWGRYPPFEDEAVPQELARRLGEADSLLLLREMDAADARLEEILEDHPGQASALLKAASVHYYRGNYHEARNAFLNLTRTHPGLGLAHFGVIESTKRLREARDPRIREAYERFRTAPRPPEPLRLRDVFVDYDRLDEDLQKIVLLSVAPLGHYIPILAISGGTHRLLPFHHRLWQLPDNVGSRGRRTFDGRLWDDVKGQGGRHAVSGEEWTRETSLERFNVLSHEFMHQIHALLTPEQRERIEGMYESAREERRTLDSYADSNPQEYLAQAYEAFISPAKDPRLSGTAGNTRARVRELDPEVSDFLAEMNDLDSYLPHAVLALRRRLAQAARNGPEALEEAEEEAAWVLRHYGEAPELLLLHASVARLQGDYDAAFARHARLAEILPDDLTAHIHLAEDRVLGWHDHEGAATILESFLRRHPQAARPWLHLASHRLGAGDADGAASALERSSEAPDAGEMGADVLHHLLEAELSRLQGDGEGEAAAYRRVLDGQDPEHPGARAGLARLALAVGDMGAARRWLGPVPEDDPEPVGLAEARALLLLAEGQGDAALVLLHGLRERQPARLETLTALLTVAREVAPEDLPRFVQAGRALLAAPPSVETDFQDDRAVGTGSPITAAARREFERVAAEVVRETAAHDADGRAAATPAPSPVAPSSP